MSAELVTVAYRSRTEQLSATVDHALLIVQDGDGHHRAYFATENLEQLGQMVATAMALALENGDGRAMAIALGILRREKPGEFRGNPLR